ncbi:protein phosphatase 2C domain-containing protein [Brevibacillus borstelensis]|uniref:protein phosphatase 2C domain-containing protein n=1 Tax=Brevibacillus borstelensis TaxID=45462 RepID=UPI0030BE4C11
MNVETLSIPGYSGNNEDSFLVNTRQQVFAVIDGVSSLVPFVSRTGETGGAMAAQIVRDHLATIGRDTDLPSVLLAANESLRDHMISEEVDLSQKEALWGAAAAVVRLDQSHLHYAQTGDCMIFAVYADDTIRVLTHLQVSHLEKVAMEKWEEGIRQGLITRTELIESVRHILVHNRYQANAPGGYGVLNGEPLSGDYLEYGRINRIGLKAVLLLTDGLFWPVARGEGSVGWEKTVRPILEKGLQTYTEELVLLEKNDPECIAYPRFKPADDKTGVVIHLPEN